MTTMPFESHGNNRLIMQCRDEELLVEGAAGTGKTMTILHKLLIAAEKYAGMRAAIIRKTRASMTQTVLQTFEDKVLPSSIRLHTTRQSYSFPNGSEIAVGGMDKPDKILSSEYDIIYVNEGIELSLPEHETLITRLRHGVIPYQQLIVDVNPGPKSHYLNKRANEGQMVRIKTTHRDNPALWDGSDWTAAGKRYLSKLSNLSGVQRQRFFEGIWATAEGVIYPEFDESVHLVDAFEIPAHWPRYRVIDFGFVNPFVCLWGATDEDGRLFVYRQIYMTRRTVNQHAPVINRFDEPIWESVADHDAEDRATLDEHGISTLAADKRFSVGVEKVRERLKVQADGRPRLYVLRDSLVELDHELDEGGRPTCLDEEFGAYVWHDKKADQPVKEHDHGLDALRYLVMYLDANIELPGALVGLGAADGWHVKR